MFVYLTIPCPGCVDGDDALDGAEITMPGVLIQAVMVVGTWIFWASARMICIGVKGDKRENMNVMDFYWVVALRI